MAGTTAIPEADIGIRQVTVDYSRPMQRSYMRAIGEDMSAGMWTDDGKYGVGAEGGVWAIFGSRTRGCLGMGISDLI
jgi:hypothetical protein